MEKWHNSIQNSFKIKEKSKLRQINSKFKKCNLINQLFNYKSIRNNKMNQFNWKVTQFNSKSRKNQNLEKLIQNLKNLIRKNWLKIDKKKAK